MCQFVRRIVVLLLLPLGGPALALVPASVETFEEFKFEQWFSQSGAVNLKSFGTGMPKAGDCSGVAISSNLVLTAAHCVDERYLTLVAKEQTQFSIYGLKPNYTVMAAQGLAGTTALVNGQPAAGLGAIRSGFVDAVAWSLPGLGPDLAVLRISPGYLLDYNSYYSHPGQKLATIDGGGYGAFLAGAFAVGYSYGPTRMRLAGSVLPSAQNSTNDNGTWVSVGWRQEVIPAILQGPIKDPTYNATANVEFRERSVRLIGGDSGGPLYSVAQFPNGTRGIMLVGIASAIGGDPFDDRLGLLPQDTFWVDVDFYRGLVGSMHDALHTLPAQGASPIFPNWPIDQTFSGSTAITRYSADVAKGMTYFDPPAGEAEEIVFQTPGLGFTAIDLLDVDLSNLKVLALMGEGYEFVEVNYSLVGSIASFASAYRGLRLEGLGVKLGTELTFGLSARSLDGSTYEGIFEWRGINALQPVPEPGTAAYALFGLLALWGTRRARRGCLADSRPKLP